MQKKKTGKLFLIGGIAVVLVILVRPSGLFGYREFSITGIVRFIKRKAGREARAQ